MKILAACSLFSRQSPVLIQIAFPPLIPAQRKSGCIQKDTAGFTCFSHFIVQDLYGSTQHTITSGEIELSADIRLDICRRDARRGQALVLDFLLKSRVRLADQLTLQTLSLGRLTLLILHPLCVEAAARPCAFLHQRNAADSELRAVLIPDSEVHHRVAVDIGNHGRERLRVITECQMAAGHVVGGGDEVQHAARLDEHGAA